MCSCVRAYMHVYIRMYVRMCMCACVCVWTELEVCTMFVGISTYLSPIKENRGKQVGKTETDPRSNHFFFFFPKMLFYLVGRLGGWGWGARHKRGTHIGNTYKHTVRYMHM